MSDLKVTHPSKVVKATIDLTSSKSESNRALIINALTPEAPMPQNLAAARDTQTMLRLLKEEGENKAVWDVLDAGTTMRFLTAFAAVSGREKFMTGSHRMQERPIGVLVNALRELGAEIIYTTNEGYPPMQIKGFSFKGNSKITMRGDVSSQYISALLMVAPLLPEGITIEFSTDVASWPYLDMTIRMMEYFGAEVTHPAKGDLRTLKAGEAVIVKAGQYKPMAFTVEADWSAASYWYSIVALAAEGSEVIVKGLKAGEDSLQGDAVMAYNIYNTTDHIGIMEKLGVKTDWKDGLTTLSKVAPVTHFEHDFTFCPDIAQTVAVICAAKGIEAKLSGLESLRIKETDRINAIRDELAKFGVEVIVIGDEAIQLVKPKLQLNGKKISIETYDDHRMAMSFAPLGLLGEVEIKNSSVVNKSYPAFWADLSKVGFEIE